MTWGPVLQEVTANGPVLAHGLGGRTDLPPDPLMAAVGAAVAVGASFLVMGILWPQHRLGSESRGRPLPRLTRVVDSRILSLSLRTLVLLASSLVTAVAFLGPAESRFNLAPYMLYVIFWVGLALTAVLIGPVWPRVNPLRTLHSGICRLARLDRDQGLAPLPPRLGVWPAAGWLLMFVWLELVYPDRAQPGVVGLFLVAYAVVTVVLAFAFGRAWFAAGDGFEVYNKLFGALSPLGRGDDGVLVLRNPLSGLASLPRAPGLTAVVVVLIGSTGFDGLTRTSWWQTSVRPDSVPLGTLGLLALVAAVGGLYATAMNLGGRLAKLPPPRSALLGQFAHSLVPIALGYTVAHYFSFFLFEGQIPLALASDPFGQGWDLLGTVDRTVDYLWIGTGTIARVQVYAIVIGHVCGVIAAHDRALALLPSEVARRSQYPLGVVMVGITLCGVLLLLSS